MRAFVDPDLCISCGFCAGNAPEVFEIGDEGKAAAIADTTEENIDLVQACIDGCPVAAIRDEE
ncbi:MAG: ferredoxin [Candidatus Onthomonas sp.]|nr:ferredoxin [Candidatus Onthomonas sp.]